MEQKSISLISTQDVRCVLVPGNHQPSIGWASCDGKWLPFPQLDEQSNDLLM